MCIRDSAGGVEFDFFAGTTLAANESLVVMHFNPNLPVNSDKVRAFESRYGVTVDNGFTGGFAGRLSEVGERVELQSRVANPSGDIRVTEDSVVYDTTGSWPSALATGESLVRTSAVHWGSTPSSWESAAATPSNTEFSAGIVGDLTGDGIVDVHDIDTLTIAVASGRTQSAYDITGDGTVDAADISQLATTIGILPGDANLDGIINANDLNAVGRHWLQSNCVDWSRGEFTGDGIVDVADLKVIGLRWLQAATPRAATAALPPPQITGPQADAAFDIMRTDPADADSMIRALDTHLSLIHI